MPHRVHALLGLTPEQLDQLSAEELTALHEQLNATTAHLEALRAEVAARRAERWWQAMPREDMRTIRLLLKGARVTPQTLRGRPEYTQLLLLLDIEDPTVVRLWAELTPADRAARIADLHRAMELTDVRRRTTAWDDEQESRVLAYDVLGLSATATWQEVRRAYRELAARYHPDQGGDGQLFKTLQKAYKLLEQRYL